MRVDLPVSLLNAILSQVVLFCFDVRQLLIRQVQAALRLAQQRADVRRVIVDARVVLVVLLADVVQVRVALLAIDEPLSAHFGLNLARPASFSGNIYCGHFELRGMMGYDASVVDRWWI